MNSLPKVKRETTSHEVTNGSYCYSQKVDTLAVSTGHPLNKDGRRVGSDDFHVIHVEDRAGLGTIRLFSASDSFVKFPYDPTNGSVKSYRFRPAIASSWRTGYYADDVDDKSYVTPVVVPFDTYVTELNSLGTQGIRRARPGNPAADLGQFLVELRELPRFPIFLKERAKKFKDLGSEYLNIEFGWLPFVRDLKKACKLSTTLPKRLEQLKADNGKWIRRRRVLTDSIETSVLAEGTFSRAMGDLSDTSLGGSEELSGLRLLNWNGSKEYVSSYPPYDPKPHGSCVYKLKQVETRYDWFKGTFGYYVPDIGSSRWTARAIAALYGVNPTPSLLWEVLPWSWLIDWWSNAGDVLSNLSTNAVDNEVMRDTFVMSRRVTERFLDASVSWDAYDLTVGGGPPPNVDQTLSIPAGSDHLTYSVKETVKLRHYATPYGFGLSTDGFTARQLAILAALGISRQRF